MNADIESARRAGFKEWLGLAVLALPTLLLSVDATVLYLALPHLAADLAPNASQTLWIIDVYGFMIAGFLVTMGTLGDRIGRRKLLLIGALAFGAASVFAAFATDPVMLIVARAALGIAGATLMPSTLALIITMFKDGAQRGVAIGVWAACFSAGVAAGPLLGGALLELFWWGSVFLLAVPVMVLLLAAGPFLLPEDKDPNPGKLDLASVALSLATILPVVYGLKVTAEKGVDVPAIVAIVVGLVVGVVFTKRQRKLEHPLVDLSLFGRRDFTGALIALLVGLAVVGAVYMFVTQFLQLVAGYSPLVAGLWLLPSAGAMIVASMLAPGLTKKIPAGTLVGLSLGVSAVGYLLLVFAGTQGSLPIVVIGMVLAYLGIGPMMALGTDLVVGAAPEERAGSAAAMSETAMELGLALGVAVLGSVGAAVYRAGISGDLPGGLSQGSVDATATPAGAITEAGALGGDLGSQLATAAQAAFTSGLNVVGGVGAAVTGVVAIAVLVLLRLPKGAATEAPVEQSPAVATQEAGTGDISRV
ncbi:MFS transporter [Actinokineospora pegani]|uniref:MFS transporter n=1 Tax=Actinokineospora pegani TaxID=2654637 RepID=UPI0012EABC06|nr:MFS transporter [Actinokineospora pegani]